MKMKRYTNEKGTIIIVIERNERYVTFQFENGYAKCVSNEAFNNMIKLNNYKENK